MTKKLEIQRAEIFRGRQHKLVFLELEEKSWMVSEIMNKTNSKIKKEKTLTLRETSRALKWLANNKYAVCLNPTNKQGTKGILYKLSSQGKILKKFIESQNFSL